MDITEVEKKIITKSLEDFFGKSFKGKFIVFDLETNGLQGTEVLSISAQKCQLVRGNRVQRLDTYDRYYFPEEKFNWQAIKVNGLDKKTLTERRADCTYPEHFCDDVHSFKTWCEGITHFVGHNHIKFDASFFPADFGLFQHMFDTMVVNKPVCKMPNTNGWSGFKAPRLIETAEFYGVATDTGVLHTSSYDVEVTTQVFETMYSLKG